MPSNSKISLLRQLVVSDMTVGDFGGFDFEPIEGMPNLWTFSCLQGTGICFNDGSDRFKWSKAILIEDEFEGRTEEEIKHFIDLKFEAL